MGAGRYEYIGKMDLRKETAASVEQWKFRLD
jgi:hypothetical protein